MKGEGKRISEVLDKGEWDVSLADRYRHWYDFYEWYVNK